MTPRSTTGYWAHQALKKWRAEKTRYLVSSAVRYHPLSQFNLLASSAGASSASFNPLA
jgi:hypothetical protein